MPKKKKPVDEAPVEPAERSMSNWLDDHLESMQEQQDEWAETAMPAIRRWLARQKAARRKAEKKKSQDAQNTGDKSPNTDK
jgi:hypothetical protein